MAPPTLSANKLIIGDLLNMADAQAKKVISSYDDEEESHSKNKANLKKHDAPHLEACATFLGFRELRSTDNKKQYKNLSVLADRIILRIEALFETTCDDCEEKYQNTLTDEPPIRCQLCDQGSHNCDTMVEKIRQLQILTESDKKPRGMVWMCHGCHKKNSMNLEVPIVDIPEELEEEETDDPDEDHSPRGDRHAPKPKKEEICQLYAKRQCPHGLTGKRKINGGSCQKAHPPKCFRFCRAGDGVRIGGCKYGDDCRYFHPKLCRDSEMRRVCLNENCTLNHLKGTQRHQEQTFNPREGDFPPMQNQQPRGRRPSVTFDMTNANGGHVRSDSLNSINIPFQPATVSHQPQRAPSAKQQETGSKDFLEKLLENMKNGILSRIDSKLSNFRAEIPGLVRNAAPWNNPMLRTPQPQHHIPQTNMPFQIQDPSAPQKNSTLSVPPHMYPIPAYLGSSY